MSTALERIDAACVPHDTWAELAETIPNFMPISGYQQAWATLTILTLVLDISERLTLLERAVARLDGSDNS